LIAFDVFISYSKSDRATADAACAAFEHDGLRCWLAPRDIPGGADWGATIVEAIDNCRMFVLIFSTHANDSVHIRNEVVQAVNRGVPVVPVRIEDVLPTKALAYYMGGVQWLDALGPPMDGRLEAVARSVHAILGERARTPSQPEPAEATAAENKSNEPRILEGEVRSAAPQSPRISPPRKGYRLRRAAIAAISILVILAVGAFVFRQYVFTSLFVTSYLVCVGEPSSLCPSGYVVLPCGSSVPRWANHKCANHIETELSHFDNFCGPILTRVQCGAPWLLPTASPDGAAARP
jgi:hypothetical protein